MRRLTHRSSRIAPNHATPALSQFASDRRTRRDDTHGDEFDVLASLSCPVRELLNPAPTFEEEVVLALIRVSEGACPKKELQKLAFNVVYRTQDQALDDRPHYPAGRSEIGGP